MKKILFISHDTGNLGAPNSLLLLIRQFIAITDWKVRILVRNDNGTLLEHFQKLGKTYVFYRYVVDGKISGCFNSMGIRHARVLQEEHESIIRKELSFWNPDLIYSNTAMNGDVTRKLNLLASIVTHVRELEWFLKTLKGVRLNGFLNDSSLFLAVSRTVKLNLIHNYGIDASKIKVANAAILPELINRKCSQMNTDELKEKLNISRESFVIGSVGRIDKRKGWDLFCQFAQELSLKPHSSNLIFLWVGDGPDKEAVKREFEKNDLSGCLRLVGKQRNPFPYYKLMNVFVLCSRDDPFPRVNIEAGYLNCPVIAFNDSGGTKEFIDGGCGIGIPGFNYELMAEEVLQLLTHPESINAITDRTRKKILNHYTVNVVANKIRKILFSYFNV